MGRGISKITEKLSLFNRKNRICFYTVLTVLILLLAIFSLNGFSENVKVTYVEEKNTLNEEISCDSEITQVNCFLSVDDFFFVLHRGYTMEEIDKEKNCGYKVLNSSN